MLRVFLALIMPLVALAQRATLRPAEAISLPGDSDSNSPVHWWNGKFAVIQSIGLPLISKGAAQSGPLKAKAIFLNSYNHAPIWIESTWLDDDGTLYAWYHHEVSVCSGDLSTPKIGALVSTDGGDSFRDLGLILESGYPPDCAAQNGYFAGGHGDFTVLLDSSRQYFYFYFGNYSGPQSSQGIAVARMAFADRARPAGRVWKFFRGAWREPGLDGRVTAILPATVPWGRADADSFWGPALHWNTFLERYVMLLNRTCCEPEWPPAGIYISFNPDLGNPYGWTPPEQILNAEEAGWYPQVIGLEPGMTDKVAGKAARFFMGGDSNWEIIFDW